MALDATLSLDLKSTSVEKSSRNVIGLLPALNALLNALATVFLVSGFVAVRRRQYATHIKLMFGALMVGAEMVDGSVAGAANTTGDVIRAALYGVILLPWAVPTAVSARMWEWIFDAEIGVLAAMGAGPQLLQVGAAQFVANPHLREEVFGPASLLVRCADVTEVCAVLQAIDVRVLARLRVGYIRGVSDNMVPALQQLGPLGVRHQSKRHAAIMSRVPHRGKDPSG